MDMEQQTGQSCIICGQMKEEGIVIVSHFICEDCENRTSKERLIREKEFVTTVYRERAVDLCRNGCIISN